MEESYVQQEVLFALYFGLSPRDCMSNVDKLIGSGEKLHVIRNYSKKGLRALVGKLEASGEGSVLVGAEIGDLVMLNTVLGEKQSKWGIREAVTPNSQGGYSKIQAYFLDTKKPKSEEQTFRPRMHLK